MAEPVINKAQYYGTQSVRNGRITFIGETRLAVNYANGLIIVVPKPEMDALYEELTITGQSATITVLADWMARRLGMVVRRPATHIQSKAHEAEMSA